MREARLVWKAAVGEQPADVVADEVMAPFEAAMVVVGGYERRLKNIFWGIGEEAGDIGMGRRPIGLEDQKVVAAALDDGIGDPDLSSDSVDGDDCTGQFEPFEQQQDGFDLVGFVGDRLLAAYQALAAGSGGDHVQRLAAFAAGVTAP